MPAGAERTIALRMSSLESRSVLDGALREITERHVEASLEQIESAAAPDGPDPKGLHASLAYLNWLIREAEDQRRVVMECIEGPPEVTGNPWSDCICNDARYEFGHMESARRTGVHPTRLLEPRAVPNTRKPGTSMGGFESSPERRRRDKRRRKHEEERWDAKNGPVIIKHVEDRQAGDPSTASKDVEREAGPTVRPRRVVGPVS